MAYQPAAIVDDWIVTGGTGRSAANDNLLAASGGSGYDTLQAANGLGTARSMYVQITGSSGISAGAIAIEGSNDGNAWQLIPFFDVSNSAGVPNGAAVTIAASTDRFFACKLPFRYVRVRISTAFSGGTVSAVAKFSVTDFIPPINVVANTTPSALITALGGKTSGGHSIYSGSIGATATQVKGSAGQVYGWHIHNPNASIAYVQFFNTAVGSVTPGSTSPVYSLGIPANSTAQLELPAGIAHSTAIVVAVATTRTGGTGPGSTVDLNIFYT